MRMLRNGFAALLLLVGLAASAAPIETVSSTLSSPSTGLMGEYSVTTEYENTRSAQAGAASAVADARANDLSASLPRSASTADR